MMFITVRKRTLTEEEGKNLKIDFQGNQSCTGYTGGGGQRVNGKTVIGEKIANDVYGQYGGGVIYQPSAYFWAENQYHGLFGWETKRTGGLRIVGTNISYNIGSYSGSNISVDQGTNGELLTSITYYVFYTNQWFNSMSIPLYWGGNVTFYGMDGSTCSL